MRGYSKYGLSQDLEIGCPQCAFVKFWGILMFQGRPQYIQLTLNIYLFIDGLIAQYQKWINNF